METIHRRFFGLVSLIFLLACGCRAQEAPVPALLPPAGLADDTAAVIRRDVEVSTYLDARLKPEEYDENFGNTYLSVGKVVAGPGQKVKKGDVLIQLDTEDIQKSIDDLTEQLDNLQKQYGYNDADRQTDIAIARIQAENVSPAALTVNGADNIQTLALQRLQLADTQAKEAEDADLASRRQAIDNLTQTRDQAVLTADRDGTVVSVPVSPGDAVKPFAVGAVIADDSSLYAQYTGKISSVALSDMISITGRINGAEYTMQYEPMSLADQIAYIFNNLTPPSKFTFEDPAAAGQFTPGQSIEIHCVTSISKNTLAVPVNAVYTDGSGNPYVYKETADSAGNRVKTMTTVATGLSNESFTEITKGLNEGDAVYVKP